MRTTPTGIAWLPARLSPDGALQCPRCEATELHHGRVTVYAREEDAERVHVAWTDGQTTIHTTPRNSDSGNPSSRRGAVCVDVYCEHCHGGPNQRWHGDPFHLALVQHKGSTLVQWVR